jgi:hypothetical protein
MVDEGFPRPKIDYPKMLWETASTLTDNSQNAAVRKARELGLDLSQGEIPFEETLNNLVRARDVLLDTVEKGRLVQLPLRLQSRLLQEAKKISQSLVELINGTDSIRLLENAVEELTATIWQLNLQNQSESVLGFERKMNELKAQEVIVKRSMSRATRLISRLDEAESFLERMKGIHSAATEQEKGLAEKIEAASNDVEEISKIDSQTKAIFAVVQEHESAIAQSAAESRKSIAELNAAIEDTEDDRTKISQLSDSYSKLHDEVAFLKEELQEEIKNRLEHIDEKVALFEDRIDKAIDHFAIQPEKDFSKAIEGATEKSGDLLETTEARLEEFLKIAQSAEKKRDAHANEQLEESVANFQAGVDEARTEYDRGFKELEQKSNSVIEANESDTKELISNLDSLEGRIRDAIERATGYTLFHSFQARQEELKKSTRFWSYALLGCVLASVGVATYFIHSLSYVHEYKTAFFIKLSLSLPLIFALTFCSIQYNRERRLEEEYAFKSSISISLDPYQRLVQSLVDMADINERAKYPSFIISSINKVFTSPTGLVYDAEEVSSKDAGDLLKTAGSVAKDLLKARTGS